MLKGINKQIIEIKCPESEYFEKILLFVKPDKDSISLSQLGVESYEYYSKYVGDEIQRKNAIKKARFRQKLIPFLVVFGFIMSGLIGLLLVLLILG